MPHAKVIRRFGRPFRDFSVALGAFTAVTVLSVFDSAQQAGVFGGPAHAYRFVDDGSSASGLIAAHPAVSSSPGMVEHVAVLASLALALAGILTLNLWFARHVRRVNAAERKRAQH